MRRALALGRQLRSLLLLSGYLGRALTQVIILWVFAHEAGAAGAGQFAFALAVSSPVFVIFELALRNVYQTLQDAPSFRLFLVVRVVGAALATLVVVGAAAVVSGFPPSAILLPLLAMKFADSVLDICLARFQVEGRLGMAAGHQWANNLLTVGAISLSLLAGLGATSAIVGSAVASALVAGAAVTRLLLRAEPAVGPVAVQVRRVLRAGVVLGLAQALMSLLAYIPTLYLTVGATKEAVGVFAACQYAVTLGNLFFNSAVQTWLSRLRRAYATEGRPALDREWRPVAIYITAIAVLGSILTLVFLAPAVERGFGAEFAVSIWVVLPLALAIVVLGVEYSVMSLLLVLNLYSSRVAGGLIGVLAALVVAGMTLNRADVTMAGYVILAGATARCMFSVVQLVRNSRQRVTIESPSR